LIFILVYVLGTLKSIQAKRVMFGSFRVITVNGLSGQKLPALTDSQLVSNNRAYKFLITDHM